MLHADEIGHEGNEKCGSTQFQIWNDHVIHNDVLVT